MSNSIPLSICIPSHRNYKLKVCLDKIIPVCKEFSLPICICDNDDSASCSFDVSCYDYENITYIKNEENIGADRNMIKVIEAAKTDYIFWLGDDDFFTRDTIIGIEEAMHRYAGGLDMLLIGFNDSHSNCQQWNDVLKFYLEYEPNPIYFGNIVLKKSPNTTFDMHRYDGSLHAYYAYILEMLSQKESCTIVVDERISMTRNTKDKSWKGLFNVMLFCVPKFYKTLPEPFHSYWKKMVLKRYFYYIRKIIHGKSYN